MRSETSSSRLSCRRSLRQSSGLARSASSRSFPRQRASSWRSASSCRASSPRRSSPVRCAWPKVRAPRLAPISRRPRSRSSRVPPSCRWRARWIARAAHSALPRRLSAPPWHALLVSPPSREALTCARWASPSSAHSSSEFRRRRRGPSRRSSWPLSSSSRCPPSRGSPS